MSNARDSWADAMKRRMNITEQRFGRHTVRVSQAVHQGCRRVFLTESLASNQTTGDGGRSQRAACWLKRRRKKRSSCRAPSNGWPSGG